MKTQLRFISLFILGFGLVLLSCKIPEAKVSIAHQHFVRSAEFNDSLYNCYLNGTLTKEERRNLSHFRIAKKIKIISFSRKVVTSTPIDKNMIASKYVKDEITLTEDQIDQLTEILYNYNYSKDLKSWGSTHGACYEPRHSIVFLNSSDKVFGYFELCFTCENHETLPAGENMGVFCSTKYELLKNFFKSVGIQFFEEEKEK